MKINPYVAGRRFGDAIPDGQNFRLRFLDGYELLCAWGSDGPEAIGEAQGILTNDIVLHPQFHYVRGKTVKAVYYDHKLEKLTIEFTDGHVLRSGFGREHTVEGVDVKVRLPEPQNMNLGENPKRIEGAEVSVQLVGL